MTEVSEYTRVRNELASLRGDHDILRAEAESRKEEINELKWPKTRESMHRLLLPPGKALGATKATLPW